MDAWQRWVIGAVSTIAFLFATLYINSVSDRVATVSASIAAVDSESRRQGERIAVLEEQQKQTATLLKEIRDDVRGLRNDLTTKPR